MTARNSSPAAHPPAANDGELPSFSEDGVDLTLIRWMLSLTPEERLDVLESYLRGIEELRSAKPC